MNRHYFFVVAVLLLVHVSLDSTVTATLSSSSAPYKSMHEWIQEQNRVDFSTMAILDPINNKNNTTAMAETILKQFDLTSRIAQSLKRAHTMECRAKIAQHVGYFLNAYVKETAMPFTEAQFSDTCPEPHYDFDDLPEGMHIGMVQNRTYQPSRTDDDNNTDVLYLSHPADLKLLYAILTHQNANDTKRLISVLYEPGHVFVIHVDAKADDVYNELQEFAQGKPYVHLLPSPYRCRVNWGGYTMVNATLQLLKYSHGLLPFQRDQKQQQFPLEFHKWVHLSSTSYPIASNTKIRETLASFPLDANFLNVVMKPTRPHPAAWSYFVECDDWVHRIGRLHPLSASNGGVELYTASQWFILSTEFASYLANATPGTLVYDMMQYTEHVVVADELFFGTILRNTEYCTKHHNTNFLQLHFDRYENEVTGGRDERKCIMADPNHCGRSPTTMTGDYAAMLELSGDLFARKFVDPMSNPIKDYIDSYRQLQEMEYSKTNRELTATSTLANKITLESATDTVITAAPDTTGIAGASKKTNTDTMRFEGHGVLIVAKDTAHSEEPLCMGLGPSRNKIRLLPCFHEAVIPTLAPDWETGAVIMEEIIQDNHLRWSIGPCSSDGTIYRSMKSAEINVTSGLLSASPQCMLTQVDGLREGRCLDIESGIQNNRPGGVAQVYPCAKRWHQFFSFGSDQGENDDSRTLSKEVLPPKNAIYASIPKHYVQILRNKGDYPNHEAYLCLSVRGRLGNHDEEDWVVEDDEEMTIPDEEAAIPIEEDGDNEENDSLLSWVDMQIVSTQCSNTKAVIEWIYVPFIVEDEGETTVPEEALVEENEETITTDEL